MPGIDLVNPTTIPITDFKGIYSRGMADSVPLGYFSDAQNVSIYERGEVRTRYGTGINVIFPHPIVRIALYKRLNETSRFLILDNAGNFYDSVISLTVPLISNPIFEDFSMVNFNNRAYITFHNRVNGVGPGLYVYQGGGNIDFRLAAGTPPSSFILNAVTSATAGSVEVGTHLFAIAFETNSGFVTAPGPAVFAEYDAPGGFQVDLSNIPVGPAGTVARWILATPVLPDYDGNQFGATFFFIPDGRIADNTTTTATVDFFDADLFVEADYLFDNRSVIPAGSFINIYANRLVIGGVSGNAHSLYVSNKEGPESFNELSDTIVFNPSDASRGVTNCVAYRNALYVTKDNSVYVTQELANTDPNGWAADNVDHAIGTECFGISTMLDAKGTNTDRFFLADVGGLFVFEAGIFRKPSLSYNIDDIWGRINASKFNLVQVAHDSENYLIYIAVPLDASNVISHVLVGNYQDSIAKTGTLTPQLIKWSYYTFPYHPTSILTDKNNLGKETIKFGSSDGNIYQQVTAARNDNNIAIDSFIKIGLLTKFPGWVCQFTHLQMRVIGTGSMDLHLEGMDGVVPQDIPDFLTLVTNPGREFGYKINLVNEKLSVMFRMTAANEFFNFFSLIVSTIPKWMTRVE